MTLILLHMASDDQKRHVAPQCNCLDTRNAMVLLTMLSASYDSIAGATGVT